MFLFCETEYHYVEPRLKEVRRVPDILLGYLLR